VEIDTLETIDPLHRNLAEKYLRTTPWASEDTAIEATRYQFEQGREEEDRKDEALRALMRKHYPLFEVHYQRFVHERAAAAAEPRHPSPNPPSPPAELAGPGIDAGMPPPPLADLTSVPGPDGRERPRAVVEAARRYQREGGLSYAAAVEKIYRTANDAEARGEIDEGHFERALELLRRESCGWQEALFRTDDPAGRR
jgi:hypothetical protein